MRSPKTDKLLLEFFRTGEAFLRNLIEVSKDEGAVDFMIGAGVSYDDFALVLHSVGAIAEPLAKKIRKEAPNVH